MNIAMYKDSTLQTLTLQTYGIIFTLIFQMANNNRFANACEHYYYQKELTVSL